MSTLSTFCYKDHTWRYMALCRGRMEIHRRLIEKVCSPGSNLFISRKLAMDTTEELSMADSKKIENGDPRIGDWIRWKRDGLGMSQAQLADQIACKLPYITGYIKGMSMSAAMIGHIEQGR